MDRPTAKLLLESFRPADADDPFFAEALHEAESDPELKAWFAEIQRLDGLLSAKLREVPVPADLKSHILLGQRAAAAETPPPRARPWLWPAALAAGLVAGFLSWHFLETSVRPAEALAGEAIAFTGRMPALQFVCFDAAAVAQWVNEQPGSRQVGLRLPDPGPGFSMAMIGSSVVQWNNRPVVMICLQHEQRMAMLYILKASDAAGVPEGAAETMEKDGWAVRTTKIGDQVRLLTTKGSSADLNFPIPF